jgi:orotidine-5'-phosphate decarboxylase
MPTGFKKLERAIKAKGSHICLGLDPTDEMDPQVKQHGGLENYLKWLIDETHEYIVAIKPNLAFYEKSAETREILKNLMTHADKYGLVKIFDPKRGDIMDTQTEYARADIGNFDPDIVTLNPYMGGADVVAPYLAQNERVCVYVMGANSNPGAREFQDLLAGGIFNYQQIALLAHGWSGDDTGKGTGNVTHKDRVGLVVGSTKPDAIKNIRMIELEHGFAPSHILCPGFGKQGGDMEFVKHAGVNALYPLSSALTKDKYLKGKTPREMAKAWRDDINAMMAESEETQSLTQHVVDLMIAKNLILIPKTTDFARWPVLKKGRNKLEAAGITLKGNEDEQLGILRSAIKDKVLTQDDFGAIFLQIRDVMGFPEIRRLMAYLYAKKIKESGVQYDRIGSVAYGAINTGDLASLFLDKPAFLVRKELGSEATHGDIIGGISPDDTAIMIEDVATSADSLIKVVKILREKFNAQITDAFVFVKRTPESEVTCKENGVKLHYIMDMAQLKKYIEASKFVTPEIKKMIL